jgi:uncharacterized protein GlcG (DUF336 family)
MVHKVLEPPRLESVGMNMAMVITTTLAGLAVPAQAQLLTHRDLSYPMARTIAEAAIESCGAKGYAVSAVVVDRAGEVMVAMRADGAGPHTMENARRKAYTALTFRIATSDYAKRYADNNPIVHQQVTLPSVIAIPGGLPVKVGGGRDRRGRCLGFAWCR